MKFTERGDVGISVDRVGNMLQMVIKDMGIGMDSGGAGRLFKFFEQVNGSIDRRFGGTGLGLVFSRQLVRFMGGWITLQSEKGKGITFLVELPVLREMTV